MAKTFVAEIRYESDGVMKESGIFEDLPLAIEEGKKSVEGWLRANRAFRGEQELALWVGAVELNTLNPGDIDDGVVEWVYVGHAYIGKPPQQGHWSEVDGGRSYRYSDEFSGREDEIEVLWGEEMVSS